MKISRLLRACCLTLTSLLLLTPIARAQVFESFVSGTGDDGNRCTRTQPCKTFAGALRTTLPGGVVTALDPGNFGPVTITGSISIEGNRVAQILANGTNAITVSAGPSDVVALRGLTLDGLRSAGGHGILVNQVGSFVLEDTEIRNFGGNGILFAAGPLTGASPGSSGRAPNAANSTSSRSNTQHNVFIHDCGDFGMSLGTLANPLDVGLTTTLVHVQFNGNHGGGFLLSTRVQAAGDAAADTPRAHDGINTINYNSSKSNTGNITDSGFSGNGGCGGVCVADFTSAAEDFNGGAFTHSVVFLSNSVVAGNSGNGAVAFGEGAAISMSNVQINANAVSVASLENGQIISFGNNLILGNTAAGAVTSLTPQQ